MAKLAMAEGKTIRQVAIEHGLMTGEEFDQLTSAERVTRLGSPQMPLVETEK